MNEEQIRNKLINMREELEAGNERTHKHLFNKQDPVSAKFSDQVKERENDDLVRTLDIEGQQELQQVYRALQRLDEGGYGVCQSCGQEIPADRLLAVPVAETCIACSE